MTERRCKLELGSGCSTYGAMGVCANGDDARWRRWIEFDGHAFAGNGDFPATRAGHACLKAGALSQLERLVWPPRRRDVPEDVQ